MKKTLLILSLAVALIVQMTPKSTQASSGPSTHAPGAIIMGVLMAMGGALDADTKELLSPENSPLRSFSSLTDMQKEFALLNCNLETSDLVEQTATGSFHAWVPVSRTEMNGLTTSSDLAQQAAF